MLILELGKGDVFPERLTLAQDAAEKGLYAEAMAGFTRWLASRYESVRGQRAAERAELRKLVTGGQHARTPNLVADLAIGLRYLLDFAEASAPSSRPTTARCGARDGQRL